MHARTHARTHACTHAPPHHHPTTTMSALRQAAAGSSRVRFLSSLSAPPRQAHLKRSSSSRLGPSPAPRLRFLSAVAPPAAAPRSMPSFSASSRAAVCALTCATTAKQTEGGQKDRAVRASKMREARSEAVLVSPMRRPGALPRSARWGLTLGSLRTRLMRLLRSSSSFCCTRLWR